MIKYRGIRPNKEPFIACLSHTAGWHEFLLYWLYYQFDPIVKNSCLVLSHQKIFDSQPFKWIFNKINIVWLDKDRNIKKIIDKIQKEKYKMVLIAPGGCDNNPIPWKIDYYYVGKSLGWGFRVIGFDFESKRLKIGPYVLPGKLLETESSLQKQMGDIVPLKEKNSFVPIRKHDSRRVSMITKISLLPLILIIIVIVYIFCLRGNAKQSLGSTIFHVTLSLYGLYLQTNNDIAIRCIGLGIIYSHLIVIYMGFPRLPENASISAALFGIIIGISKDEPYIYVPMLYSLLSKVPKYAKNSIEQCRAIVLAIVLSKIIYKIRT